MDSCGALTVACASAPRYRAEPLTDFLPGDFTIAAYAGVEVVACRLTEASVVRVLGSRSAEIAANAAVFQVRLETAASAVKVMPDSFRLDLPTGETVRPMSPGMVAGAVSGSNNGLGGGLGSIQPMGNTAQATSTADALAKVALASVKLGIPLAVMAIERSSENKYWNAVRVDVEGKTALPREIAPGHSLELLVVFWRQMGTIPDSSSPTAMLELVQNGQICYEELVLREP